MELNDKNSIGSLNAIIKYLNVISFITALLIKKIYLFIKVNYKYIYLKLLGDPSNEQKFKLKSYNLNNYLKLDSGAFNSLNLLPNSANGSSNIKNNSLYGVLNRCVTSQGQRLLTQWIKQPLIDIHKIVERQNIVEILMADTQLRMNLIDNYLKRFHDFQKIEWRFHKKKATLQVFYQAKYFINLKSQLKFFNGP